MKVLIVCSGNAPNFSLEKHQSFVYDQVESTKNLDPDIQYEYFFIKGKGLLGYLSNIKLLKEKIATNKFDLIHAHYSYSGYIATTQNSVPVITTYHGTDINNRLNRLISLFVCWRSKMNIFVDKRLHQKVGTLIGSRFSIIPCGVDLDLFDEEDRSAARKKLNFDENLKYILFSSAFGNPVKNFTLLKKAVELLNRKDVKIVELNNYSRKEVVTMINASNLCVMTSFNEGSPQFIKEAMACNCPVISTDVGDVKYNLNGVVNCHIVDFDPRDLAQKIEYILDDHGKTDGRGRIKSLKLDSKFIATNILVQYKSILS